MDSRSALRSMSVAAGALVAAVSVAQPSAKDFVGRPDFGISDLTYIRVTGQEFFPQDGSGYAGGPSGQSGACGRLLQRRADLGLRLSVRRSVRGGRHHGAMHVQSAVPAARLLSGSQRDASRDGDLHRQGVGPALPELIVAHVRESRPAACGRPVFFHTLSALRHSATDQIL